jgi:hypothetical protein
MAKITTSLEHLRVATPCKADWDDMMGDDRVRFCGQCQKNVYNLSNMSRKEAERLVINREGGMCVRFYRRADGTVITANCPVGLRNIKRRMSRVASAIISAVLGFITGIGAYSGLTIRDVDSSEIPPVTLDANKLPVTSVDGSLDESVETVNGQYTIVEGGI